MIIAEVKQLLLSGRFHAGAGIIWHFNDTTILVGGKPVTRYELLEDNGSFYLHTEQPVTTNEDYLIEVLNEHHAPFKIILTPRYSKRSPIALERMD